MEMCEIILLIINNKMCKCVNTETGKVYNNKY